MPKELEERLKKRAVKKFPKNEKRQRERQAGFRQRKNNFKLTVL